MDERKFIKKCKEFVRNYYNDRVDEVTAWMPLPNPYK